MDDDILDIIEEKDVIKIKRKFVGGTKCYKCENTETYIKPDGEPDWRRYKGDDNQQKWGGESYLCRKCYAKIINNLPDSYKNLIKEMRKSRTGNFSRFERPGKTAIGQWIGAKTLGLKDLNIENNNFREPIDLSIHHIHGNIDVKIAMYNHINDQLRFDGIRRNFDNLLLLCMDMCELWKDIISAYMIPIAYVNTESITIVSSRGSKWKNFRIDEKPFNQTYHSVDIPEFFSPFDLWKCKYDIKSRYD